MQHNFKNVFCFDKMFAKILILLKILLIGKMNTKHFHGFVMEINTFHGTECQLKLAVPANSHFVLLGYNLEEFEKLFNSFINSIM